MDSTLITLMVQQSCALGGADKARKQLWPLQVALGQQQPGQSRLTS